MPNDLITPQEQFLQAMSATEQITLFLALGVFAAALIRTMLAKERTELARIRTELALKRAKEELK